MCRLEACCVYTVKGVCVNMVCSALSHLELPVCPLQELLGLVRRTACRQHELINHHLVPQFLHVHRHPGHRSALPPGRLVMSSTTRPGASPTGGRGWPNTAAFHWHAETSVYPAAPRDSHGHWSAGLVLAVLALPLARASSPLLGPPILMFWTLLIGRWLVLTGAAGR